MFFKHIGFLGFLNLKKNLDRAQEGWEEALCGAGQPLPPLPCLAAVVFALQSTTPNTRCSFLLVPKVAELRSLYLLWRMEAEPLLPFNLILFYFKPSVQ